ncbi:hypothetical protein Syun_014347 [Stephania yunnanensis]|uniref:Uncharacterized protein n=1 Tax=Stephania yunnanensis TaxID=152371 RepID=A0AAP0JLH1_9MAGN
MRSQFSIICNLSKRSWDWFPSFEVKLWGVSASLRRPLGISVLTQLLSHGSCFLAISLVTFSYVLTSSYYFVYLSTLSS